jgi:hypothetical protein
MLGFAGTILQGECLRRANMQDAEEQNDAAAKDWQYLHTLRTFRVQT